MGDRNVLGGELEPCGTDPVTGFYRDGCCHTGPEDLGSHTICAVVTAEFLDHQRQIGNDLTSPAPQFGFPGLVPGDRWCVTAVNWLRAHRDGVASPVVLASTHERALEIVPLRALRAHAVDVPASPAALQDDVTQPAPGGPAAATSLGRIWQIPDGQVASGRIPGYVAAVRAGRHVEARAGGRMAVGSGSAPMREDTLFRIASLTKPVGGALTLSLVQDGVLALDDPIARWLPEAARPRVLVSPGAPLDRTAEARRPITVRHLLTLTCGWGAVLEETPLRAAMLERGIYPGPLTPPMSGDEFVARVAGLPLAFQPGEGWLYDTGIDVLGVLLARAAGRPLSDLVAERITGPLGMTSTGFWAPDPGRLATAYQPKDGRLEVVDPPDGAFARPPRFEELGSGLVSTAPDVLRFFCALADGGEPVLTADSVALMTADALTGAQRRQARPVVGPGGSWGLGTGVDVEAAQPWMAPGRWGWNGGTGTTAYADPARGTVGVLLTQRELTGPEGGFDDFWTAVAAAA